MGEIKDGLRRNSLAARKAKAKTDIEAWLREQGAVESVGYDEDTGMSQRRFTIDLTKPQRPPRPDCRRNGGVR